MSGQQEAAISLNPEDFGTREVEVHLTVRLTLHPEVINRVDDEWRSNLYQLHGEEDVAEHLLYNFFQGRKLDQLDGWADLPSFGAYVDGIERIDVFDMGEAEPLPGYEQDAIRRALVAAGFLPEHNASESQS